MYDWKKDVFDILENSKNKVDPSLYVIKKIKALQIERKIFNLDEINALIKQYRQLEKRNWKYVPLTIEEVKKQLPSTYTKPNCNMVHGNNLYKYAKRAYGNSLIRLNHQAVKDFGKKKYCMLEGQEWMGDTACYTKGYGLPKGNSIEERLAHIYSDGKITHVSKNCDKDDVLHYDEDCDFLAHYYWGYDCYIISSEVIYAFAKKVFV